MACRDFTTQERRIPWSQTDRPAVSAPQPGPVSVSRPGLWPEEGWLCLGGLGRDGEQAAAHTTPWVLRRLEAGSTRAVCAGRGDPEAWGGSRGAVAELGHEGEFPRAVGRDTAGVWLGAEVLEEGTPRVGASAPRPWPGAQAPGGADQGSGRFGLSREEGWVHLPLWTWGPSSCPLLTRPPGFLWTRSSRASLPCV